MADQECMGEKNISDKCTGGGKIEKVKTNFYYKLTITSISFSSKPILDDPSNKHCNYKVVVNKTLSNHKKRKTKA